MGTRGQAPASQERSVSSSDARVAVDCPGQPVQVDGLDLPLLDAVARQKTLWAYLYLYAIHIES